MSFDVLMATYKGDSKTLLRKALQSIEKNTLLPNRTILVIDGPIGGAARNIIEEFSQTLRIVTVELKKNSGFSQALNAGLPYIESEYIARCDSDDINHPERFMIQMRYLRSEPAVDVIGSHVNEVDFEGNVLRVKRNPVSQDDIDSTLPWRSPFSHSSVVFKTEIVKKVGGYPTQYGLREDYALWIKLHKYGARWKNIDTILVDAFAPYDTLLKKRKSGQIFSVEWALLKLKISKIEEHKMKSVIAFLCRLIALVILPKVLLKCCYMWLRRKKQCLK